MTPPLVKVAAQPRRSRPWSSRKLPGGLPPRPSPSAGSARTTGVNKFHSLRPPPKSRQLRRTVEQLLLGATLVPGKSGANDRLKVGSLRPPAEPLGRAARIGHQHRRITWPSGGLAPGDWLPAKRFGRGDYFSYRMTTPCSEVERHARAVGAKMLERT